MFFSMFKEQKDDDKNTEKEAKSGLETGGAPSKETAEKTTQPATTPTSTQPARDQDSGTKEQEGFGIGNLLEMMSNPAKMMSAANEAIEGITSPLKKRVATLEEALRKAGLEVPKDE